MKLPNIYLILLAITVVIALVFGSGPRNDEHTHQTPVRIVCW